MFVTAGTRDGGEQLFNADKTIHLFITYLVALSKSSATLTSGRLLNTNEDPSPQLRRPMHLRHQIDELDLFPCLPKFP